MKILLAFGVIYFVWGSTYLAIKYAVESIPPLLMMGTRSIVAGAVLFAWSRMRRDDPVRKEHWPSLIIIGVLFFLIGHGGLAWAQQKVPSGLAALLIASEPMWIAVMEWSTRRDFKVGTPAKAGLVFGFLGIALLILPGKGLDFDVDLTGPAVILLTALSWASGAVYLRSANVPKSPILTASLELIIGGILLIGSGLALGEMIPDGIALRSVLSLGYLIIFGSVITFSAYVWLLTITPATRVSTHTYVNPVVAVFLGWVLAGEQLTLNIAFAALIIVLSVYLVLKDGSMRSTIGT